MPESLSRDEVAHLADLARIDLTEAELDHLAPQLSVILESVASIQGVAGADVPPTSHALPLTNVFREDVVEAVPDPGAGAVGRARAGAAAVLGPADPGGRAVTADLRRTAAELADDLASGATTSVELTQAALDRIARGRRRGPRVPPGRHRGRAARPPRVRRAPRRRAGRLVAGRRADRGQGRARDQGPADHLRLEDPRGLGPAVRRDRGRQGARGRAADPRQDQHGRVRDGLLDRALGVRRHAQPVGPRPGSRAAPAAARPPRWPPFEAPIALGTDTGGSIRQPGAVTGTVGVKPTYGGVSRYGLVALANSLDQVGPVTRTVLDAALLHEIIGGHDPKDSTSIDQPLPALVEAARQGATGDLTGAADRRGHRAGRRGLPGRRADPVPGVGRPAGQGRRRRGRGVLPALRARAGDLLPDPAGRGVQQPGPLRRDALRPAGAARGHRGAVGRGRHARHPRGGLRRRGEAPDHPRHLRAVERLLRRLLRPGPEGADADLAGLRERPSSRPTCWSRRPRRPRRSRSARRSTTRWRCTSTTWPPSRPTCPACRASRCRAAWRTRTACPAGFQILAPALADDRVYRVGAALEALLLEQWGGPLLDQAPALDGASA